VKKILMYPSPRTFFFLHTYQVHSPYHLHPRLEFSKNLLKAKYPLVRRIPEQLATHIKGRRARFRPLSDWERNAFVNLYKSEIEFFDHQFGSFIGFLKKRGIYDRSLIIVFSDHGESFYDHSRWGHSSSLYNEELRIPLIMKFPYSRYGGKRIPENCSIIDIFPTLLDFLGKESVGQVDGKSLMRLVRGETAENSRVIYSVLKYMEEKNPGIEKFPQKLAVIWKNFKLIYNFKYTKALQTYYSVYPPPPYVDYELYDLDTDREEKRNIAGNPKYSKILKFLKRRINRMKRDIFKNISRSVTFKVSDKRKQKLKALGYL